jgi:hypothetical protein
MVPNSWRHELLVFLNNVENFRRLKLMLQGLILILEKDGYQMSFRSVDELIEMRDFLQTT